MNSLPNNDLVLGIIAIIGLGSISLGLITGYIRFTVGFRKVVEIEKLIDPDGSRIQKTAGLVGSHLIGRMLRTVILCFYFVLRRIPGFGVRTASKWGDVGVEVPWRLTGWVVIPALAFWFSIITVVVCYYLAQWIETSS